MMEEGHRTEPSGMTLADLVALIIGFALAFSLPSISRLGGPMIWAGRNNHPIWFTSLYVMDHLVLISFLALFLVGFYRRLQFGGPIRASEALAIWVFAPLLNSTIENLPGIQVSMSMEQTSPGLWTSIQVDDGYWSWARGAIGLFFACGLAFFRYRRVAPSWLLLILTLGVAMGLYGGIHGSIFRIYRSVLGRFNLLGSIALDGGGCALIEIGIGLPLGVLGFRTLRSWRNSRQTPVPWTIAATVLVGSIGCVAKLGIQIYFDAMDGGRLGLGIGALATILWLILSIVLARLLPSWKAGIGMDYDRADPSQGLSEA